MDHNCNTKMISKSKVNICGIIKVTAGKNHYWVTSDVGIIRKPINAVREMFTPNINVVKHNKQSKLTKLLIKIIIAINYFIDSIFFGTDNK